MPSSLLLLLATILAAADSSIAATYANCNRPFSCGSIVNVTYPFTGGDRPSYCGLPEFALTCRDNAAVELTHDSLSYRVLRLDQTEKTLVLARSDLYNDTCPAQFRNTTLNSTVFNYNVPQNEVLNLFFGCNASAMSFVPYNLFRCNSSRFLNFSDAYHLIGPVPRDPILKFLYCSLGISLPLLKAVADRLARAELSLGEALMQGFTVNYSVSHERFCSECSRRGGQCGLDPSSGRPICICDDTECPFNLSYAEARPKAEGSSASKRTAIEIGLPLAVAVLIGVGLGWLIFYCRQRRKKWLAANRSVQLTSKELVTNLSSSNPVPSKPPNNYTLSRRSSKSSIGMGNTHFGAHIFSYKELEEATENFDRSRAIGDGGYGAVYYGVLSDDRKVAIKRLYENNINRMEQFMNEVEILTRLRHPNLVTLHGCTSKQSRELLLVYEYIPNGTVADHLHGKHANSGLLSWPCRLNIAIETAGALAYLHRSNFIHRDVKTANILLDSDFHVKVADFGLSRLLPNDVTHVSTAPQGTPGYVDPEYYQYYQLTEKSDVYSFGVVLVELISSLQAVDTSRHRHDINLSNMAVNKIQTHKLHELVDPSLGFESDSNVRRITTLMGELAFRCLQQEREMRPSMEEVFAALIRIQNEYSNADHRVEIADSVVNSAELLSPDSGTKEWLDYHSGC